MSFYASRQNGTMDKTFNFLGKYPVTLSILQGGKNPTILKKENRKKKEF